MQEDGRTRSRGKVISGVAGAGALLFGGTLLALGGFAGADSQTSSNIPVNCTGDVQVATAVPSVTVTDTPDTATPGGSVSVSIAAQLPSVPLDGTTLETATVTFPIPAQVTGLSNVTFTGGNVTGVAAVSAGAVTFTFTGPAPASSVQMPTITFTAAVAAGTVGQTINWTVFSAVSTTFFINSNGTTAFLNNSCTPADPALVLNTTPVVEATTTTTSTTTTTAPTTTTTAPTTTTTAPTTTTTAAPTTTSTTAAPSTTSTTTAAPTTTSTTRPGATPQTVVVTPSTFKVGDSFSVRSTGWKPGTTVQVVFQSDPVPLGSLTADANGVASGSFRVPAVAVGAHTVVVTGLTADGIAGEASTSVTVIDTAVQGINETNTGSTGSTGTGALPTTGSSSGTTTAVAVLLMGAGTALVAASRRRPTRD